jgi:ABC-2 family transporter protein
MNFFSPTTFAVACVLVLIQVLAALPWLWVLDPKGFTARAKSAGGWLTMLSVIAAGGAALMAIMLYRADPGKLEIDGRIYGAILHLQLVLDLVLALLGAMLFFWPKGGTVAWAAFREGYRQPMFWLISGLVVLALFISMVIPYFTLGEDFRMMKHLSFDMIKLSAVLFAVLAAGMSVSEEIEGRTAVTLMSKPVTRRQFLLGKYFGILLAALAMTLLLGWVQNWVLYMKPHFDRLEDSWDPLALDVQGLVVPYFTSVTSKLADAGWSVAEPTAFFRGVGLWAGETLANAGGLALGFGQVMVMLAVAVSLATRMSMIVSVILCVIFFMLGNLAPVLADVSERLTTKRGGALNLVNFLAQLLDKVMPSLNFFNSDHIVMRETYLPPAAFAGYVGSVFLYALMYAAMALLVGLFLIEDRDLA